VGQKVHILQAAAAAAILFPRQKIFKMKGIKNMRIVFLGLIGLAFSVLNSQSTFGEIYTSGNGGRKMCNCGSSVEACHTAGSTGGADCGNPIGPDGGSCTCSSGIRGSIKTEKAIAPVKR
jgi:hypothetical protein